MASTRVDTSHPGMTVSIDDSTVFIVDDHPPIRESISFEMESVGYMTRAYDSAEAFLDDYDPSLAGCLILDVRMQKLSGLQLQEILNEKGYKIPVIVISGHADVPMAVRAMKANAMDFLQKPIDGQVLLDRVNQALVQDAERRAKESQGGEVQSRLDALTPREREVLQHVIAGEISTEIATILGVSYKTIEAHRASINRKMAAKNVAQLIAMIKTVGQ